MDSIDLQERQREYIQALKSLGFVLHTKYVYRYFLSFSRKYSWGTITADINIKTNRVLASCLIYNSPKYPYCDTICTKEDCVDIFSTLARAQESWHNGVTRDAMKRLGWRVLEG